jgi:2,4-dienoyl-CoA reductase-like NADH-dependent reductase (Old Yellow Enzyme family)
VKLFEPFTINGKLTLKNRIVMPALVTRLATEAGEITEELLDRYLLYARGGTGLIITEAISVRKQKSGPLLRLSEDRFVPSLRELTDRVHGESDARIAPQIIHFMKTGYSGHRAMPPLWMPEKVNVYLAADIRKTLRHAGYQTPIVTSGRIPNAGVAESLLENREADLVAIARPSLCDPHWPRKTVEGREQEILRCVYCNKCKEADEAFQKVYCAQWKKGEGSFEVRSHR